MPVRCVTQFLSSRHTSSASAHHNARKAKQNVSSNHGMTEVDDPRFQSMIVLELERMAKIPKAAMTYRRPDDATRRSTPPDVFTNCQVGGSFKDSDLVIGHRLLTNPNICNRVRNTNVWDYNVQERRVEDCCRKQAVTLIDPMMRSR